jgi:hypothetical protein
VTPVLWCTGATGEVRCRYIVTLEYRGECAYFLAHEAGSEILQLFSKRVFDTRYFINNIRGVTYSGCNAIDSWLENSVSFGFDFIALFWYIVLLYISAVNSDKSTDLIIQLNCTI